MAARLLPQPFTTVATTVPGPWVNGYVTSQTTSAKIPLSNEKNIHYAGLTKGSIVDATPDTCQEEGRVGEQGKKYSVGIYGSYGGLNLGDEAILHCIIRELRSTVPVTITVFTSDPEHTLRYHNADRAVEVARLSREEVLPEIRHLDLLILGGGGILFDGNARTFMREVSLAHEYGVPVVTYAIGAGPLEDASNQKLIAQNLNKAAAITVRERSAKRVLEEAGVKKKIIVTADPALLLTPEPIAEEVLHSERLNTSKPMVGISVREPGPAAPDIRQDFYHELLANSADYMVDRFGADIVFVPMEPEKRDMQHAHAIMAQMLRTQQATVLKGHYTPAQLLYIMKSFDFAVGMRLHFLIFAALQKVPFVGLPYASKVMGFLEDVGIEFPPLRLVNAGRLLAHIDASWDRRTVLIDRVEKALPQLQERARLTNRLVTDILIRRQSA